MEAVEQTWVAPDLRSWAREIGVCDRAGPRWGPSRRRRCQKTAPGGSGRIRAWNFEPPGGAARRPGWPGRPSRGRRVETRVAEQGPYEGRRAHRGDPGRHRPGRRAHVAARGDRPAGRPAHVCGRAAPVIGPASAHRWPRTPTIGAATSRRWPATPVVGAARSPGCPRCAVHRDRAVTGTGFLSLWQQIRRHPRLLGGPHRAVSMHRPRLGGPMDRSSVTAVVFAAPRERLSWHWHLLGGPLGATLHHQRRLGGARRAVDDRGRRLGGPPGGGSGGTGIGPVAPGGRLPLDGHRRGGPRGAAPRPRAAPTTAARIRRAHASRPTNAGRARASTRRTLASTA